MGAADSEAFPSDGEGPVRAERLGRSYVFASFLPGSLRRGAPHLEATPWWCGLAGAAWDRPKGPGGTVDDRPWGDERHRFPRRAKPLSFRGDSAQPST
jgi:hypothetical protein